MKKIALMSLLLASPAAAQQTPNPQDQIACQLGQLMIQNTVSSGAVEALRKQVAEAQAKIKELEEKQKKTP